MKAKVTGVSAWQDPPLSGTLDIEVPRYVDAAGRASVSRYTGVLNATKTGWANSLKPSEDLWLIVQGPDDPQGVRGAFRETLVYANRTVVTEFSRVLRSSDLTGLIFDYNEPIFEPDDLNFGDVPLTMRAAQQLLDDGSALIGQVGTELQAVQVVQAQVGTQLVAAQDTANLAHGTLLAFQALNDLSFAYDAAFSAAGLMLVTEGWAVRPVRGAAAYDIESATPTAPLRLTPNGDGTWDLDVDDTRFTTVTSPSGEVTITRTGAY